MFFAFLLIQEGQFTGSRSKIFNEIVLKNNRLLTLHENVYRMSTKRDMVMQLNFTYLPKFVWHSKNMVAS